LRLILTPLMQHPTMISVDMSSGLGFGSAVMGWFLYLRLGVCAVSTVRVFCYVSVTLLGLLGFISSLIVHVVYVVHDAPATTVGGATDIIRHVRVQ
jgi:hypothetical protein